LLNAAITTKQIHINQILPLMRQFHKARGL
jgi:hypothetical protein